MFKIIFVLKHIDQERLANIRNQANRLIIIIIELQGNKVNIKITKMNPILLAQTLITYSKRVYAHVYLSNLRIK